MYLKLSVSKALVKTREQQEQLGQLGYECPDKAG
jgi:hypothetical protein